MNASELNAIAKEKNASALEARVRAVNAANAAALEWHPKLAQVFSEYVGKSITTAKGDLLKKLADKVKALGPPDTRGLNAYLQVSRYSIYCIFRSCEVFYGCSYYHETSAYICDTDEHGLLKRIYPLPDLRADYTPEEVTRLRREYKEAHIRAEAARGALYPFKEYD